MLDKEFGEITIVHRANMRRITARWKNGVLTINSPKNISDFLIFSFINNNREQLLLLR